MLGTPAAFPMELFIGNVQELSSGDSHSVFLTGTAGGEHRVYSFGQNNYGQLGHNGLDTKSPRSIRQLKDISFSQVACGAYHTLVYQ